MPGLSNAEIAKTLLGLAQLLALERGNAFKVKAYRRAAKTISGLAESVEELVRNGADLTAISGIGKGISSSIHEIVHRGGSLQKLEELRQHAGEDAGSLTEYPLLDPKRVQRVYKKLGISSVAELGERLERGEIGTQFGAYMERHVRTGLQPATDLLLYDAHPLVAGIREFLTSKCNAKRAEAAGGYRRNLEVVNELSFVVETADFEALLRAFQKFGGRATLINSDQTTADFQLSTGVRVRISNTTRKLWGLLLLIATGSEAHLSQLLEMGYDLGALAHGTAICRTEEAVYEKLGLPFIPPELREANGEIEQAAHGRVPELVTAADIRGELHAHTTSSDGTHTIEQMGLAAQERGYEYLGITDHSKSLTIAHGVSEADLWAQIRYIDKFNEGHGSALRILKAAEVDILPDGALDYSDSLLKELDYTVCSIHSKFSLSKKVQTERVMRAMDNRHFNILGHATGRRLLKRPGYELDLARVIEHARKNRCFFEINSSPERLDLSAENARIASQAGVMIAINTDAHSTREFNFISCGIEQARRAGLEKGSILNCLPWSKLHALFRR